MLKSTYSLVMDPNRNPLRALPKMVRFQYMVVLAYMWSAVFSIYIGTIALFGPSIVAHTILLIGVFFTADIFRRARKRALSYDELSRIRKTVPPCTTMSGVHRRKRSRLPPARSRVGVARWTRSCSTYGDLLIWPLFTPQTR
jgi:hypothetical protein